MLSLGGLKEEEEMKKKQRIYKFTCTFDDRDNGKVYRTLTRLPNPSSPSDTTPLTCTAALIHTAANSPTPTSPSNMFL
jgi:hypothetical protein